MTSRGGRLPGKGKPYSFWITAGRGGAGGASRKAGRPAT
jgi:hypothetical protein